MRVVHLVIGGDVAGGQLVALELARAARRRGHAASFLSPTPGAFLQLAEREGFAARVVPLGGALDVRSLLRLTTTLRTHRADLLHTHAHFSLNVLGRLAARMAGARVVAHMHIGNVFRQGAPARRVQTALDNVTARLCDAIVAVSEATRDALLAQGYPDRVVVVRNGVPLPPATEARRPEMLPNGPLLLLVGRLAPVKGQRELIDALVRMERGDAVAVLAGEDLEHGGSYRRALEAQAERLGVGDRVAFAGHVDDVSALLAAADAFVLPSWDEGLPLTVLEAMAAGKPVVATRVGGTPEAVLDGETGLLVPPGDVAELAAALDAVLSDPERARQLGTAGRERVRRQFSAEEMGERVMALYRS